MHRSLIFVALVAMTLTLLATAPVVARRPVALGVASQNSTDLAALDAFAANVGARPATWTLWSTWGDRGGQYRCFKGHGTCIFPGALARGLRARGVMPLIYWQPTNPADPGAGRFERYRNIIAGKHDRYIREWARAAKAFGKPVIVRLAHEMNGTWFPWSLTNFDNTASGFQSAWRHVVREFRRVGARNVMFLWSPFQRCGTCSSYSYEQFYPGNRYVDYVGVSALNWGDVAWTSLDGLVDESLADLRRITRTARHPQGKPVILPEIASNYVGGDKAAWIRDGYGAVFRKWKAVRAMSYFDYDTTFAGQPDWRLVQPPDGTAFQAYQSLATQRVFRASMPPRPAPGPRRWRLMPLIHVVAQDGTGDFATITEAVRAARARDVILIRAGTYDESVSVGRDVMISGDGDRAGVVVQPSTGSPSFALGTTKATLANLTLRGTFAGVTIDGGAPTLDGLSFDMMGVPEGAEPRAYAVLVSGGASALIRGNTITGGSTGILIADSAAVLEGNDVSGTSTAGIQIDAGAPRLSRNAIHDNQGSGVAILGGSATLLGNTIAANATGLVLGASATPTLSGNSICANATNVHVLDGGQLPILTGNEVCPDPAAEMAP